MSTKRIGRTAIEGGRETRNKVWRRASNRSLRKRESDWMRAVTKDSEEAEEGREPRRWKIDPYWNERREFADKLRAPEAWLASMSGLPWNVVNARIRATLDDRTLAGRHLLHFHLLPSIVRLGWSRYGCTTVSLNDEFVITLDGTFLALKTRTEGGLINSAYYHFTWVDGTRSSRTAPFDPRHVGRYEDMSWQQLVQRLNGRVVRESSHGYFQLEPIDQSEPQPSGYRLLGTLYGSDLDGLWWDLTPAAYARLLSLANARFETFVDRRWNRSVAERFVARRQVKQSPEAPYFHWVESGRVTRPLTPEEAGTFLQFPQKWQKRHLSLT